MNYDKNTFDSIKKNILDSGDTLKTISEKIKNTIYDLDNYNLINRRNSKTNINDITTINDEMLSFVELTISKYDELLEEIGAKIISAGDGTNEKVDATSIMDSSIIVTSIKDLIYFSRDLSNIRLFGNHYTGYYYAQNDVRWRDLTYIKNPMGSSACQALAIVNSLGNLGYHDTYSTSLYGSYTDSDTSLVMKVRDIIAKNPDINLGTIINELNKDRVANGLSKIDITCINNTTNGFCSDNEKMLSSIETLNTGSSKWLRVSGEGKDTFINRIEYIEEHKQAGVEYSYSVCRINLPKQSLLGGTYGHYITVNDIEFDSNGKVENIYVLDSYARNKEDVTMTLNGKECIISGYNTSNGRSAQPFEIITPGLLKIPREDVLNYQFSSCNLIVTRIK